MIESLHIGSSGMHAQQTQVDVIANNLANINTTGFKKSRVEFEDLMYKAAAATNFNPDQNSVRNPVGVGTAIASTSKIFSVGEMKKTEGVLDIAIQGKGFFEVIMPDGSYGYTRAGALHLDENGFLANVDGHSINPDIQIPEEAESILFRNDGQVLVKLNGEDELASVGRIELAQFVNASGLRPLGDNLYLPTNDSGDVYYSKPGEQGAGQISQGYLEVSNVKMVEELTNLILAQRAYELNSKVVQASDEMLSMINNLRR